MPPDDAVLMRIPSTPLSRTQKESDRLDVGDVLESQRTSEEIMPPSLRASEAEPTNESTVDWMDNDGEDVTEGRAETDPPSSTYDNKCSIVADAKAVGVPSMKCCDV